MAYTYGTSSPNITESVATAFERIFVQNSEGQVTKTFKKHAQSESSTQVYSANLPALASGDMSNGAIVSYEYSESNTDEPKLTTNTMSWGAIP